MLSTAKPTLQNNLKSIIQDAAEKAYMELFCKNAVSEAGSKIDEESGKNYNDKANEDHKKIAEVFAQTFANKAAEPLATAIHNFVKEIGISCTIPPSVISPIVPPIPGGPCSGTIPPTSFTIL